MCLLEQKLDTLYMAIIVPKWPKMSSGPSRPYGVTSCKGVGNMNPGLANFGEMTLGAGLTKIVRIGEKSPYKSLLLTRK